MTTIVTRIVNPTGGTAKGLPLTSQEIDGNFISLADNKLEALTKVMHLRGVTYNSNKLAESFGFINKNRQVGVIAQDVEAVLPEAVKPAPFDNIQLQEGIEISKSGENYKTVQYEKLVPLLIEAIKELSLEVQQLKELNK